MHDQQINAYRHAMDKYLQIPIYRYIERTVSCFIVLLQSITLVHLCREHFTLNLFDLSLSFLFACLLTDFINGLVHMYMDNNTHYDSWRGPFVASFHLHHARPRYVNKPLIQIYFFESGTKFWLLLYLILLYILQRQIAMPLGLNCVLVFVGILSSIAEVSHYLAHNADNNHHIIRCLQKYRFLLSSEHHKPHHVDDNINYAFLNGLSDPLLNLIARYVYTGYKNNADLHTKAYIASTSSLDSKYAK